MALTAKFISDFTAFFADMNKASSMMGGLQGDADKVAGSIDTVGKSTGNWQSALAGVAGVVGVAFSVNAVKNFALSVIDTAGNIGDMSEKLGISATAVQRFGYAADQSGASIGTVDSAIKKMNDNLAGGSKSTVAALNAAGLEFATIRRLSPEQAFVAIGDAVARIEDPMLRAKVATELFGKAGQELIPTFLAGIQTIGDQTSVMADDTVRRLKDAQDAWERFKNAVVVASGEWIAEVEKDAQHWVDAAAKMATPFRIIKDVAQDTSASALQTSSDVGAMVATLTPGLTGLAENGLKPVALNAEQVDAAIGYLNATLVKAPPIIATHTKAIGTDSAALFDWQKEILLTKFKVDQLTVSETQLFDATDTLASFVASHKGEMFPEPPPGSLEAWERGQQTIVEMPPQVDTLRTDIGLLSQSFANLGSIGGKGLNDITRGLGSVIGATDATFKSVDTLKGGFSSLGKGSTLSGIASITSGIGGIVAAAQVAIVAIQKLWSWAKGGEEGQVVNPARDTWFGGRSVQDIGDQLAPYMGGEEARKMIESVFNAKNKQDFGAASGAIDRILAGNSFASGTGGVRDFGAGTLAMLHGREAVVPESAMRGGGGLGGSTTIIINAQGAFFDTPGELQRLADKVNDALTAKYGLTNRARAA